jgi:hypothetical protein
MRLRRAVLQTPAKSSVLPRLPFHKNCFLPTPSQSTLPQLLISLHFNSFRTNVYKKTGGRGPAAEPKVCQLVTCHKPRLRTRTNSCNPNPLIRLLHSSLDTRVGGVPAFSVYSVASALKFPIPNCLYLCRYAQAEPQASSLSLFTTHHPLLTHSSSFQGKIYPTKSRSHHV